MRKVLGALRRGVDSYKMISDGDKIVVGVSGGKDSMLLFYALSLYKQFAKENFELIPVHVDMGFEKSQEEGIRLMQSFIEQNGSSLEVVKTDLASILFDIRKESNPCSLCSKIRRGALCTKANALGATKIALAHHADDVLETMLMSFVYESRLSTFKPKSYMDRTAVTVIRPFVYLEEKEIKGAIKRHELPILFNPCPYDKATKREYMKDLIKGLCRDIPFAKERMIAAITHPERYSLWEMPKL